MIRWLQSMFLPEHDRCHMCSHVQRYGSSLPLCEACLQRIPWIRRIICSICGRPDSCLDCVSRQTPMIELQRSAVRYDASMRQWLSRYKYAGEEQLAFLFAKMMAPAFGMLLDADDARRSPESTNLTVQTVLTFVPSGPERLTARGFNQSARLALILAEAARLPIYSLLRKVQTSEHQSKKSKAARMQSVQGLFALNDRAFSAMISDMSASDGQEKNLRIIIVDDVYTTGSTLHECGRLLRTAVAGSVLGLTWARS